MKKGFVWLLLSLEIVTVVILLNLLMPYWLDIGIFFKSRPQFKNAFKSSGIEKMAFTRAASWVDFNNDGLLDIFLVAGVDGSKLFKNTGEGFVDATPEEFELLKKRYAGIFADYDNDGCQDLFVAGYNFPDHLFKGNCEGGFADVTEEAGIKSRTSAVSAAWADYNNDGYLDLYVATYGFFDNKNQKYSMEQNILYRNNGDGTFRNVTKEAGVEGLTKCGERRHTDKRAFQPVWFDYNNDNLLDLFVSTDVGISPFYENLGNGIFKDVTKKAGLCIESTNMGVALGDYDNDLDFDLYITNVGENFFWENMGDGTFRLVKGGKETRDKKSVGWGDGFLDYDNDGDLDLYVANGSVRKLDQDDVKQNVGIISVDRLFENLGNKNFKEVTEEEGIIGGDRKIMVALGDYNNDGFTDIFIVPSISDDGPNYRLYRNEGNDNNWIGIKLNGRRSNRDSIGARIIVEAGGKKQLRSVHAGSSFSSQDSLVQTIGLGKSSHIDSIQIIWPSGETKIVKNVTASQTLEINE